MSIVHRKGRQPLAVKNLGWLLRHWKEVQSFDLIEARGTGHAALMVAHLDDGGYFMSHFESYSVMRDWVRRPVFRGLPLFGCEVALSAEEEDIPVRGNVQCLDPKEDEAAEDAVIERLERGEVWAWCYVQVKAVRGDCEGSDSLGACSYEDARDFCNLSGGYFEDMVRTAVGQCRAACIAAFETMGTC